MADDTADVPAVETTNDYGLACGQNLPNHSASMAGRGKFVRQVIPKVPEFRTKQEAYRYAAWLATLAETHLPDDKDSESHTFEEVQNAIRNT